MTPPWQDRLARTRAGAATSTQQQAPTEAPARPTLPSADTLTRLAPGLRPLLEERAALERQMAQWTGGTGTDDPRYHVAPMAQRRAELARWAAPRDRHREASVPMPVPAPVMARVRRPVNPAPPLRKTAGEAVPEGRVPLDPVRWSSLRDTWTRTWREKRPPAPQLPVPDDPYLRDTARKLAVTTGSLDDIGEKSDRLRRQARALRGLAAADEAGDEARRDRALERLQARRASSGDEVDTRRDSSQREAPEPLLSRDRRRPNKEATNA